MAYRGDLIGCEVTFPKEKNGTVLVRFTLNGCEIAEKSMKVQTTGKKEDIYPFITMGYEGIQVLAKVKHTFVPVNTTTSHLL